MHEANTDLRNSTPQKYISISFSKVNQGKSHESTCTLILWTGLACIHHESSNWQYYCIMWSSALLRLRRSRSNYVEVVSGIEYAHPSQTAGIIMDTCSWYDTSDSAFGEISYKYGKGLILSLLLAWLFSCRGPFNLWMLPDFEVWIHCTGVLARQQSNALLRSTYVFTVKHSVLDIAEAIIPEMWVSKWYLPCIMGLWHAMQVD